MAPAAARERPDYVRLRQICLAAEALEPAESDLRDILGLDVSHRDERVERHGLVNAVMPLGTSFIEIVAPTREGTAAGRFLKRGGGAYMAIFDCSHLETWRQRVVAENVRIVQQRRYERYENMHLHPSDTGATLIEIHHNVGGDALDGHYDPGGDDWRRHVRDDVAVALLGVAIGSPRPQERAELWSRLLGRPAVISSERSARIDLDYGFVRFAAADDDKERLSIVHVSARDPAAALATAAARGYPVKGHDFRLAGVWFRLSAA